MPSDEDDASAGRHRSARPAKDLARALLTIVLEVAIPLVVVLIIFGIYYALTEAA